MNVPRKSAAALSVVVPINVAARLRPPRSLTKAEAEVFNELAGHAAHLRPSDTPTLASYAQSIVLCRKLGRNPDKADVWQKLTRVQMALARSLRLTPLSRTDTDSRAVGRPMVSLTPASAQRRDEFLVLMARYDQLGRLLPDDFDARDADASELADVEMVFAELDRVRAAMRAVLADEAKASGFLN
jgi:hypothetical protein